MYTLNFCRRESGDFVEVAVGEDVEAPIAAEALDLVTPDMAVQTKPRFSTSPAVCGEPITMPCGLIEWVWATLPPNQISSGPVMAVPRRLSPPRRR